MTTEEEHSSDELWPLVVQRLRWHMPFGIHGFRGGDTTTTLRPLFRDSGLSAEEE